MRSHILPLLLFLAACVPTIRIYTETPDKEELLQSAGDTIGIRTKMVEAPGPGVISIEFRPQEGNVCGEALEKIVHAKSVRDALAHGVIDCEPKAWTCDHETFASHELGHVIGGLPHVKEGPSTKDNAMRAAPKKGSQFTDEQKLRTRAMATVFNQVCR